VNLYLAIHLYKVHVATDNPVVE